MEAEFMPRWNVSPAGDVFIGLEVHTEHPFSNVELVWSNMNHFSALEDAGFKPDEIFAIREAFLKSWYLQGRFGEDAEIPQDIWVINWSHDTLVDKAKKMMRELVEYIPQMGADDGFFDYFPNAYSMVEQMYFNLTQTNLLDAAEEEDIYNHLVMVRQIAFTMRYHVREFWDLINANGSNWETLQGWIRRGWVKEIDTPTDEDFYYKYKFTERFWDAAGIPVVKELTG